RACASSSKWSAEAAPGRLSSSAQAVISSGGGVKLQPDEPLSIEQIIDDFAVLDDWDERYRYIIELGRRMPEFPEVFRTDGTKVRGCASQVWLVSKVEKDAGGRSVVTFQGDSDAMIVRGLIAILLQ